MGKRHHELTTYGTQDQSPGRRQIYHCIDLPISHGNRKPGLFSRDRELQTFGTGGALCTWEADDTGGTLPTGGILAALIEAREESIIAQHSYLEAQTRELKTWKALYKMLNLDT
jgi:hypothetical protein